MSVATNYQAVLDQLRAAGLVVESLEIGKIMRCPTEDDHGQKNKKAGWYVLHEVRLETSGDIVLIGAYGDHRTGLNAKISLKGLQSLTTEQKKAAEKRLADDRRRAERERDQEAERAAARAGKMWGRLLPTGTSRYLAQKQVQGFGVRYSPTGAIAIPCHDNAGRIWGLQFVLDDGTKRFWPAGMAKRARYALIGEPGAVLVVAEGYATAASIHEATGLPVAIAFDAGNLEPVAAALRKRWPDVRLLFAADDDFLTPGNPGLNKAQIAALVVSGMTVIPRFADRGDRKVTDFNDLHVAEGLAAVSRQILLAVANLPAADAAAPRDDDIDARGQLKVWLERYTLLYGTTTLWDAHVRAVVSIEAVKAYDAGLFKLWNSHPARRVIDQAGLVFDPSSPAAVRGTINLFDGLAMQPDLGKPHDKLVRHLYLLCGENDKLFEWVSQWLAYPLQHVGAKMRTALLIYGGEGTGKSMFFDAMRAIYGSYAATITQLQLQSEYTAWLSKKLFAVAEEVVTRAEIKHLKGLLKNLITNQVININEKYLPERQEQNCINFVFLSNEFQPLALDPGDRRYTVIRYDVQQPREYYDELGAQLKSGGAAGLYAWLLGIDCSGIDEYLRPFENEAKRDLVELNKRAPELFYEQWATQSFDLPWVACRARDLYLGFKVWCRIGGERFVASEKEFGIYLKRTMGSKAGHRMRLLITEFDDIAKQDIRATKEVVAKIWLPTSPAGAESRDPAQIEAECQRFYDAVREFRGDARRDAV